MILLQLDQFVVEDLHRAMLVDGLTTSRPIVPENVETADDINALFDSISYSKGACIVRMINEIAGDDAFKSGLKVGLLSFLFVQYETYFGLTQVITRLYQFTFKDSTQHWALLTLNTT